MKDIRTIFQVYNALQDKLQVRPTIPASLFTFVARAMQKRAGREVEEALVTRPVLPVVPQAVCGEVEQSERVKEKIQDDVNEIKQQIALRKRKKAEEEKST